MAEQRSGVGGLPAVWLVGAVAIACGECMQHVPWAARHATDWAMVVAIGNVLCGLGALELAGQRAVHVRRGMQLAALGWWFAAALEVAACAAQLAARWLPPLEPWMFTLIGYAAFASALVPMIGLGIASGRTSRGFAIVVLVVFVAAGPPPFAFEAVMQSHRALVEYYLRAAPGMALVRLALLVALAAQLPAFAATVDAPRTARSLRWAGRALQLRGVLVIVLFAASLPSVAASAGATARAGRDAVWVAGMALGAVLVGGFGAALCRAASGRVPGLGRWRVTIAGALAVWCGGAMVVRLIQALVAAGFDPVDRSTPGHDAFWLAEDVLSLFGLLVSFGMFARAVRAFAVWHQLAALRNVVGIWSFAATAGVLVAMVWSPATVLTVLSRPTSFLAFVLIGALCRRLADVVDSVSPLPAARVVSASPAS